MHNLPSLADLGVTMYDESLDPQAFWRAHFYDGAKHGEPIEFLFAEEPEHRAIETLMLHTDSLSVAIEPPTAEPPASAEEAGNRVLAVARGMKNINDPAGVAALLQAAAMYQSLYRADLGLNDRPDMILRHSDGTATIIDHKTGADR